MDWLRGSESGKGSQRIKKDADFGVIIRGERKRQGMTQLELAELSAVGVAFVSNFENGKPTSEFAKRARVPRRWE